jgi:thiamine transport system permease protein
MGCSDAMRRRVWLLALLPVLAVVFAFVLPYGASFVPLVRTPLVRGGAVTVWENAALFSITLFTLKQAFFSVLISLALGLPGAWFIGNSRSRFAPALRTLTAVPFAMPSILVVMGFVLFFGNSGWVNRIFASLTGADEGPLRILYKPEAIILAHGFLNFPLVIRLVGDGLGRAQGAYAPAAATLGASPVKTALTVILPLAVPGLMSAILLVFLYCFTSFAVVLVLGGGPSSTTIAVEIYRHARIFLNYHNAAALALVETLIAVSLFLTYTFFGRKSQMIKTDVNKRIETGKRSFAVWIIMIVYGLAITFFILGPLLSIPLESLLYRQSRSADQVLSLRWWQSLGDTCLPALLRSLTLAFFSATTACVLAVLAAGSVKLLDSSATNRRFDDSGQYINSLKEPRRSLGRFDSLWANIIRFFAAAPIVSSGIVLALGWIILYGRNFSRTPLTLVIIHAVSALPFAFNFISEGFRSLPVNILNAASVFGAGPLRGLLTTALPLSIPRIRSAWGFAAALSLGELNAVMMLGMEGWETLPLYIYRAVGAYRYGTACAAGTLLILGCVACFLLSETGRKKYA